MSNSIKDKQLSKGDILVINKTYFYSEYQSLEHQLVVCSGSGFGCSPTAIGRAVFVSGCNDGQNFRVNRSDIERFATPEEIELAEKMMNNDN